LICASEGERLDRWVHGLTDLLVSFIVMLAVGIYESWGRGPLGWVVNIVLSVIGGLTALSLMSMALETTMTLVHFQGKLATSDHPLRYIADFSSAGIMDSAADRQPDRPTLRSLKNFGEHDNQFDLALQQPASDICNEGREVVLDLCRGALVLGVDVKQKPVRLGKSDTGKDTVEHGGADDGRHARLDCVILNEGQFHSAEI
jgi:hypothetical protein